MHLLYLALASSLSLVSASTCDPQTRCNVDGCAGLNVYTGSQGPSKQGYCRLGDCAGKACASVCPGPEQDSLKCDQSECIGFMNDDGKSWTCSQGDFAGCGCSPVCNDNDPPMCSSDKCKGASNLQDKMGICGLSSYTDCSCINDCPSENKKCSDCGGFNHPDGSLSVCLQGSSLGCPCTSSCAKGKCNELDGCKGFNVPGGNSTCMAGPNAGCHCDSVCSESLMCTDSGCEGIQRPTGKGFCTAGDSNGCDCTSSCPSEKPACGGDCHGFQGICQSGELTGCPCNEPKQKRSIRSVHAARNTLVERTTDPNSGPEYYVCESPPNSGNPQDTVSYSRSEVWAAWRQGERALTLDQTSPTYPYGLYPRRFSNREGLPLGAEPVDPNDLWEFPILRDGQNNHVLYQGGHAGADRVIFDGNGLLAGVYTHRGEYGNRFHRAWGHRLAVFAAAGHAPVIGPSNVNTQPWLLGGAMGSSGNLPGKRDLAPPATRSFCMQDDWSKYAEPHVLLANAQELCKGAPFLARPQEGIIDHFPGTYNIGTDDEVDMTISVPHGTELSEDTCNKSFKQLLDGCNYNPGNPLNWKHGGNLDYGVFHFDITTRHERRMPHWPAPDGKCKSKWKLFWADFEIWGGGYASSGTTGKNSLHDQVRGCGAVKKDNFDWFKAPNDNEAKETGKYPGDHWEWRYHGRLPIGTRRCLGRAMRTAGGPSKKCEGNF